MPHQGSCLCGQTTIVLASTHKEQIACHCLHCKQANGSAYSTNVIVPEKDITMTGPVKSYEVAAESGKPVTRNFCGTCGSSVSHKSPSFGDAQAIHTGNFADFKDVPFTAELYVKERWSGVAAFEGAAQMQGMT